MHRIYRSQRLRLGDVAVFENRQLGTTPKFIIKSSLFILLLGFFHQLELLPVADKKLRICSSAAILPNRMLPAVLSQIIAVAKT
jgi:hypothetical protein